MLYVQHENQEVCFFFSNNKAISFILIHWISDNIKIVLDNLTQFFNYS